MKQGKLIKKYDSQVQMYEKNLNNQTLAKWRKKILASASGRVLEVGVGAGANFLYYNKAKVTEVIGVDFSSEMIKSAKKTALQTGIPANFIQQDVDKLDMDRESFDCIVSTLTLCSYPNPLQTLNNFNKWCKKDGYVLLLEHGLSTNPLLSVPQKLIDPLYRKVSGCHCNRDIMKLIEQSKLEIENVEHYWSGIFRLIWARPSS
ncbi:class I SAM-dependent methyltransferase [Ornithinibacillus halotolerans]|uniref:SAM-dependent methyltransferase n=1 Tax=Ornithinibacillus halotolerans TaxID=1274357 RepID=A0A916WB05_9BACI|nr:class I SAM-dependent methyltransferase [Ornithinibacillus halotolerans]GGA81545.1 SAM-dependent methyltransferase [Ornithinibacillus halotolerans]